MSQLPDTTLPEPSHFPACFAFSLHKAGSTLMYDMIRNACVAANIPSISFPDIFFHLPAVLLDPAMRLRDRKSVLLVRDPRDALVSQYFSFGGKEKSHVLPDTSPEQYARALGVSVYQDIDDYVLRKAGAHHDKLVAYRDHLFSSNLLVRRYEDIYYDKHRFLREIFEHYNISIALEIIARVATQHDVRPAVENPAQHVRQGTPGDHRRKLRPATITQLNERFRNICSVYGYQLID
jgi:hypothetical protein